LGRITKYDIERLGQRNFKLEMDCPNCGATRIRISRSNGSPYPDEVSCPKCGIHVILDALNITVVNEAAAFLERQPQPVADSAALGR